MVHINKLETVDSLPPPAANRIQEAEEIIWQLGTRLDALSTRMDTILIRSAEASRDPPSTRCERIGAYIICLLRCLGIVK